MTQVSSTSQTQGEISRYRDELAENGDPSVSANPFFVRAEIIVDDDPDQVVETAIARNTATPVKSISKQVQEDSWRIWNEVFRRSGQTSGSARRRPKSMSTIRGKFCSGADS